MNSDDKLDRIDRRIDDLTVIAIKNTTILEEHQRRSLALEKHVDLIESRIEPVITHVKTMNLMAKLIAAGAALGVALKNLL